MQALVMMLSLMFAPNLGDVEYLDAWMRQGIDTIEVHEVAPGDTLVALAEEHEVDPAWIWAANEEVDDPHLLLPGQELVIPEDDEGLDVEAIPAFSQPEPAQVSQGSPSASTSSSPSPSTGIPEPWSSLADCESGLWDANANPIPGSAHWDYGAPGAFSRPNYPFHGGLNFHPDTWNWVAPMVGLGHIDFAYNATPHEQIRVGEKVRELQGWGAWPVCSQKVGLR